MTKELGYDACATAALSVSDLKAGIAWYRDTLGFELIYEMAEMGWCELQSPVPGVRVGLSQVENVKPEGGATLTWGVNDIASARGLLEQRGVRFDGETQVIPEMVALATFFDPDGNKMMLYEGLNPDE